MTIASPPLEQAPATDSPLKLAEQIARAIEGNIFSANLRVGHSLGRERDLNAGWNVSRWTFREALSLLEQSGLIEMRRGAAGGIFVAAPMIDVTANRLVAHLEFTRADDIELTRLYAALRNFTLDKASQRLKGQTRAHLERTVTRISGSNMSHKFDAIGQAWEQITGLAGNPALSLFAATLVKMLIRAAWYSTLPDRTFHAIFPKTTASHRILFSALLDGDVEKARATNDELVQRVARLFRASAAGGRRPRRAGSTERAYLLHPPSRPTKKAESVSRELSEAIADMGWQEGAILGNESELMARFGVGRPVLREAIRSLERLGAAVMERGRRSGLKIISPNPAAAVEAGRRFLDREGLRWRDRRELLELLDAVAPARGSNGAGDGGAVQLFRAILAA